MTTRVTIRRTEGVLTVEVSGDAPVTDQCACAAAIWKIIGAAHCDECGCDPCACPVPCSICGDYPCGCPF